jgi:ABC-2 type transport system ATP-binding protein
MGLRLLPEDERVNQKYQDGAPNDSSPAGPAAPSASVGPAMIEARGLTKVYGRFAAIQDVSFTIPAGQVVAFLGPNGAGKSTTMKILTGFISPSEGSARIAGLDVTQERIEAARRLGYMPENGPLYLDMTPRDLLRFVGEARGFGGAELDERLSVVIRQCQLEQVVEKPIAKLSRGYRQRVGMAQAFLHDPDVLILDEPTSGLDPNQIRQVRRNIRELGARKTILLSTHILQEVEAMADRVIFISEGRIVFDGSVDELRSHGSGLDDCFAALTAPSKGGAA